MAFSNVLKLIEDNNYELIKIETVTTIRKTDNGKHKKGEIGHSKVAICKCPTENCSGTIRISKERDILKGKHRCRSCSVKGSKKKDKQKQEWFLLTDDVNKATTVLAKSNPDLFIREEGSYTRQKGLTKRVILYCPTPNCNGFVSTNRTNKATLLHPRCRKCADIAKKKRPFERMYNLAKNRSERTKRNGVMIKWLLTYEEFAWLCQSSKCHYCAKILDRAEYRSEKGNSTAIFLDRKDSNKDYTLDNCVPCCTDCNLTKNERISYEEMVLIMKHRGCWPTCRKRKKEKFMTISIPKTTDILLLDKSTGHPIGYVKKVSLHADADFIFITADWYTSNPAFPCKRFKGVVFSLKWVQKYLTIELTNIEEVLEG